MTGGLQLIIFLCHKPLETDDQYFFQLNTCDNNPYVTSSGWSSLAQCSYPSPTGLMATFYCFRFKTPTNWKARSRYLNPPGTGWPSYTPRYWVPFSSPPTTRRATVEIFDLASTRSELIVVCLIGSSETSVSTRRR
jgi:hypothetical protein